jgi:hypothetical protein
MPRLSKRLSIADIDDMKLAAVALLSIVLLAGWSRWENARAVRPLNQIASEIAGRSVHVHCDGFLKNLVDVSGNAGEVMTEAGHAGNSTQLRRWVCDVLKHFPSHDRALHCLDTHAPCTNKEIRTMWAVETLAHESYHLAGVLEEGRADCFAIQQMAWTAHKLGASPARADAIARYYLVELQPTKPTEYQLPPGCYDGGRFDLEPLQPGWPNPPTR